MIENGVITAESPVRLPLASIHTPISTIAVIIVKKSSENTFCCCKNLS